ncbi:MAG: hypothetical protein K6F69_02345 [Treponema sp.]|nr:hypothetical protein [Treponema sp.]
MISDQIEHFIEGLQNLTGEDKIIWSRLSMIDNNTAILNKINESYDWHKDYSIDVNDSYIYFVEEGYVLLASAKFGGAKVLAPSLNKLELIVQIKMGMDVEILSSYGDFNMRIQELKNLIEQNDKLILPDALYEFFGKALRVRE